MQLSVERRGTPGDVLRKLESHPDVKRRRQRYLESTSDKIFPCKKVKVTVNGTGWFVFKKSLFRENELVDMGMWTKPEEALEYLEDVYMGVTGNVIFSTKR